MPPSDVGVRADEVAETPVPHERSDEQVAVAPPLVENIAGQQTVAKNSARILFTTDPVV